MATRKAGYLRPQPEGYGGLIYSPAGPDSADVGGPTLEAAKESARATAVNLGWGPPYRWQGPDEADVHSFYASPS